MKNNILKKQWTKAKIANFKKKIKKSLTNKKRCTISKRNRGICDFVNISEQQFRKLAKNGQLPGITKSSW